VLSLATRKRWQECISNSFNTAEGEKVGFLHSYGYRLHWYRDKIGVAAYDNHF